MKLFLFSLVLFFVLPGSLISQTKEELDSLIIKMNTKMYLEYTPSDSSAGTFKIIESITDSTKTIRFKLDTKPAMGSILEINNPFEASFIYKAFLYNYKKKKYIETTVFPVRSKIGVHEMWPYPVDHVLIKKFKFVEEKE